MESRQHHPDSGFTLIEVMIVVAIIGLLTSIAIPNFIRARAQTQATVCLQIQKAMAGAKAQAALENKWDNNTSFGSLGGVYQKTLAEYLKAGGGLSDTLPSGAVRPTCPAGFDIYWNAIGDDTQCQSGLATHVLKNQ